MDYNHTNPRHRNIVEAAVQRAVTLSTEPTGLVQVMLLAHDIVPTSEVNTFAFKMFERARHLQHTRPGVRL